MESRRMYGNTGIGFTGEATTDKPNMERYTIEYFWFRFAGVGKLIHPVAEFRAKNRENATRNAKRFAKERGWTLEREISYREYLETIHPGR